MGLRQDQQSLRTVSVWYLPLVLATVALGMQAGGEDARSLMQYSRTLVSTGELYRLLSGHLVHLGWPHFLLNVAGLALVWYLVGVGFRLWQWLVIMAASIGVMDLCFWFLLPDLEWYVGLSGLLHGLFAAGILGIWRRAGTEAMVLAMALSAKLIYEAFLGPLPGSESSAGGTVVTEAHASGTLGGLAAAAVLLAASKRRQLV